MKNLLLILTVATFLLVSCSDEPGVSSAFAKYSHEKGVTSITVPGWLIGIVARMNDMEKDERELLKSIDKVRVLSIEDEGLNKRINLHREFQAKINARHEYEELLTVNEENKNITIFGKMEKDDIREMVILIGGDENLMVYVKGRISPELISRQVRKSDSTDFLSFKF